MKYFLMLSLFSTPLLADTESAKKETAKTINRGAQNVDQETRKIIQTGKDVVSGKKKIKKNSN